MREASVEFMLRHLSGRLVDVREGEIEPLSPQEMQATPSGQVLAIAGARSAFDLNVEEGQRLAEARKARWQAMSDQERRDQIRTVVQVRRWSDLPPVDSESGEVQSAEGYRVEPIILSRGERIKLPALLLTSEGAGLSPDETAPPILYLHAEGKQHALADDGGAMALVDKGHVVLALDVRGIGETTPSAKAWYDTRFGKTGGAATMAYLMGDSLVAMQTEDILLATRYLLERTGANQIEMVATGELTIAALHAAALEPDRYRRVQLEEGLVSWANVVETPQSQNQIPGVVHGVLKVYDLPELRAMLGERLSVVRPRDAKLEFVD